MKRRLAVVESNYSGLKLLETASFMDVETFFIFSEQNEKLYRRTEGYKDFLNLAKRKIPCANTSDPNCLLDTLARIHQNEPLDGAVTVLEYCVQSLAHSCEKLGIPYTDRFCIETVRNKSSLRATLDKLSLPSVVSFSAESFNEAKSKLKPEHYPIVCKLESGAASMLSMHVRSEAELQNYFHTFESEYSKMPNHLQALFSRKVIAEQYIKGRLFSVEVGVSGNQTEILAICERLRRLDFDTVELGTTIPAEINETIRESILTVIYKLMAFLKPRCGLFHIELIFGKTGPVIIDFNPRLMGGGLPLLYNFAFEDNVFRHLIDCHLGRRLKNISSPKKIAVSRIFGAARAGCVSDQFKLDWVNEFLVSHELNLRIDVKPGETVPEVKSNHDYLGYLFLKASSAEEGNQIADQVLDLLSETLGIPLAKGY